MDLTQIESLEFAPILQRYDVRDTMLYALGLGYGSDPLEEEELRFVYEDRLKAVPSMCSVLCNPGFWQQDPTYAIDWVNLLHAEEAFTIERPIPATATLQGRLRVTAVEDKGITKGAVLYQEKLLYDVLDGALVATVHSSAFLRGNGGVGSFGQPTIRLEPLPELPPTRVVDIPTLPCAALIYRLSGDWNPIHVDPVIARKAGFERPVLHGLCTAGIACRGIMAAFCDNQPDRLKGMCLRFSRPVYPGDTLRLELYDEIRGQIPFRVRAKERNVVVLDRCRAILRA